MTNMGLSLRGKLTFSYWVLILLLGHWSSGYFSRIHQELLLEEAQLAATRQLQLIEWVIRGQPDLSTLDQLHNLLHSMAEKTGLRITYVAAGGLVIADSEVPFSGLSDLDNHAGRPEFVEARTREFGMSVRYSGTTQADTLYIARSVEGWQQIPSGVLRVAMPLAQLPIHPALLNETTVSVLLVLMAATLCLALALTSRLQRSIRLLTTNAQEMVKGSPRPTAFPEISRELQSLAQSIENTTRILHERFAGIEQTNAYLEGIFTSMEDGVLVLDGKGKIVAANPPVAGFLPETSSLRGRRPLEVIRNPELQAVCDRLLKQSNQVLQTTARVSVSLPSGISFKVAVHRLLSSAGDVTLLLLLRKKLDE
jgi:two-component system, OmpR family, phosphate regulon sensor histidine kinase PhoR